MALKKCNNVCYIIIIFFAISRYALVDYLTITAYAYAEFRHKWYYYYIRVAAVVYICLLYSGQSKLIKSTEPFITRYYNTPLITYLPCTTSDMYICIYYVHSCHYRCSSVWPRKIIQATASFPRGIYKTQVTFGYIANPIWTPYPRRNLIKATEKSN